MQEKFGEEMTARVFCGFFGTFNFTLNPETPEFHREVKLQGEVWKGTHELRFAKPTVLQ